MKREMPNPNANKSILLITYAVVAVFVGMIAYFCFFLQVKSESVINNSYNARLDLFERRIVRGDILSNDGHVLAYTDLTEAGTETRVYPHDEMFAHAVGYFDHGKTGLEAQANYYLLSSHVNLLEKMMNELADEKNRGDSVITTLDFELQQTAWNVLGERKGAVIVMEPSTGKILAMVSKPAFSPNTLKEDWAALISEENHQAQLLNRVSQGLYPPGSTFKLVTLLTYMKAHPNDWKEFTFDCTGKYTNGDYTISCYHGTAHGHQTLEQAFANSCNGAFASLGLQLPSGAMKKQAEALLFGAELPVSFAYSKSGFTMGTEAEAWEILQTSIGQGNTQITPLHSVMLTSAIANGGVLMKPYLLERVENINGQEVTKFVPASYGSLMTASEAETLSSVMRLVVTEGTGSAVRTDAYSVAGKTGSAEFEAGKESHAWFTGFAPAENPELAVTVLVEESGSGGQIAAPIARAIFDVWFSR